MKYLTHKKTSSGSENEQSDSSDSRTYTLEELRVSMEETQKKHFGYKNLKEFQVEAVHATFHKKDSFIVMATGMGKSLCYQIPSMMKEARNKITFVVSPLISLMKDQVDNLKRKNIPCVFLGSGQKVSNQKILSEVRSGMHSIVYCSPEYALNNKDVFRSLKSRILLIAIDEVHCMSEWGHDFRPSYRRLNELRDVLSGIPFMGLTATCTQNVQDDILKTLHYNLNDCLIKRSSVNKRNLFYSVRLKTEVYKDLKDILDIPVKKCAQRTQKFVNNSCIGPYNSTLIYVSSKKECESICSFLRSRGLLVGMYHSDLSNDEKKESHEKFLKDEIQIVVATVAFGMGIDKPDIRRIIHYGFARSLEGYVQQVGRAGRDNGDAEAILFFDMIDESKTKNLIIRENTMNKQIEHNFSRVERVISMFTDASDYAYSNLCRRKKIYEYFDEEPIITEDISIFNDKNNEGICFHVQDVNMYLCSKCDNCVNSLKLLRDQTNGCVINDEVGKESSIMKKHSRGTVGVTKLFEESTDLTEELKILLECIQSLGGRTGLGMICKILIKSKEAAVIKKNYHELNCYGKGSHKSQKWWSSFIKVVRNDKYIKETLQNGNEMAYISIGITKKGEKFLKGEQKYEVQLPFFLKDSFDSKDNIGTNKTNKKRETKKRFTSRFDDISNESSKPYADLSAYTNYNAYNSNDDTYEKKEISGSYGLSNNYSTTKLIETNKIHPNVSKVNDTIDKYAYLNVDHKKMNETKEDKEKEIEKEIQLTDQQINEKIMNVLLRTRMVEARKLNVAPFRLIGDQSLKEICHMRLTSVKLIRDHVSQIPPASSDSFIEKLAVGVSGLCLLYDLKTNINIEERKSTTKVDYVNTNRVNPASLDKYTNFVSSYQYGNQSNKNINPLRSNYEEMKNRQKQEEHSIRNVNQSSYFSKYHIQENQNKNTRVNNSTSYNNGNYNKSNNVPNYNNNNNNNQHRGKESMYQEERFNINNFRYNDNDQMNKNVYNNNNNNNTSRNANTHIRVDDVISIPSSSSNMTEPVITLDTLRNNNPEPLKECISKNVIEVNVLNNTESFFDYFKHKGDTNSFNNRNQTQLQSNNNTDIFGHTSNTEHLTFRELKKRKKF